MQRLSGLSKAAAGGLQNKMIGLTTLDTDMNRAAKGLGFDQRDKRRLIDLEPGEFFVHGPAFPFKGVRHLRTPGVLTTHGTDTPTPDAPARPPKPPLDSIKALVRDLAAISETDPPDSPATTSRDTPDEVAALKKTIRELGEHEDVRVAERARILADELAEPIVRSRTAALEDNVQRLETILRNASQTARTLIDTFEADEAPTDPSASTKAVEDDHPHTPQPKASGTRLGKD